MTVMRAISAPTPIIVRTISDVFLVSMEIKTPTARKENAIIVVGRRVSKRLLTSSTYVPSGKFVTGRFITVTRL